MVARLLGHQIKRTAGDICDDLKGDYPKDFQFTSWHPHCRCIATPILKTREELKRDRQLIREGKAPQGSAKEVTELPDNFKRWQKDNAKRIAEATERGTLPHWYRDNQKLIEGAKPAPTPKPTAIERAKARYQARTPEQIADIKRRWNDRQLDRAINTHQRKEGMPFLEANRGNGNVGYIAGYGYENGKGYKINCQSCVVAHEMRLREHNVTARPNTAKRNNMPDKLSRKIQKQTRHQ